MRIQHSILVLVMGILLGCAGKPVVEVEISESIFLNAELLEDTNIYVNVRNQTDILGIERKVKAETQILLEEKGFEVRSKPSEAEFHLQAVILNIRREDSSMSLKEAFATTAVTTGTGAIIGTVVSDGNRGKGAAIGAGVGAGVGVLGSALAYMSQPGFWYGLVEVEISEPQQKHNKVTQKVVTKKTAKKQYSSDSIDGLGELSIGSMQGGDLVSSEEESVTVMESGKKKSRTKIMIRVRGNLTADEAGVLIKDALASRLANFF